MRLYAIRHKPTGHYLPNRRRGKGYTFDEPEKDCIPRLFTHTVHAKKALACWLEGKWKCIHDYTADDYDMIVERIPHRQADEMEIVEVRLQEV